MKRPCPSAWNLQRFLVRETGRLMRAKHSLIGTRGKAHVTSVAPAPSEAASGQIHSGSRHKYCHTLRPTTVLCCDARPRAPDDDCEFKDKSHPAGKVSSRAREALTSEALEDSKRRSCHLASTKHFLLIVLRSRFASLVGSVVFRFVLKT